MAPKVKKQHYVPQFYLNAWRIPDKHQIHVYDKSTKSARINNISDVASERYFYDANLKDVFSQELLEMLFPGNVAPQEDVQLIEKLFSEDIEKPFSDLIRGILEKAKEATPWHLKYCYFINDEQKKDLSFFLALQLIRGKSTRDNIQGISNCVTQMITDMGAPDSVVSEYAVSEEEAKALHVQMLVDVNAVGDLESSFNRLTWVLGINKTQSKFYTSDNPICTIPHIKSPYASMSGVSSKGVEVIFPLSPDIILIMIDGSYHIDYRPFERKIIEIPENHYIDSYNSKIAIMAKRCVFSSDGDFALVEKIKKRNPHIFDQNHVQLTWAGKTYLPENK